MDHFPCDSPGHMAGQKQGGISHFGGIDPPAQRRTFFHYVKHRVEILDPFGGQSPNRTREYGIDPDIICPRS